MSDDGLVPDGVFGPIVPGGWLGSGDSDGDGDGNGSSPINEAAKYNGVLTTFAASPAGFILGVILTPLLNGVTGVVTIFLGGINLAFFGTGPGTQGVLGIADIPTIGAQLLIAAGDAVGAPVISVANSLVTAWIDAADGFDLVGTLVVTVLAAVVLVAGAALVRKVLAIVLDVVPGGGAILE